jgi:hypothetical protein
MNTFIDIPVPSATNTPGLAVDVSSLGEQKTFVISGPNPPVGRIVVQISGDGTIFAPLILLDPVGDPGPKTIPATARFARALRLEGSGSVALSVGADDTINDFITLGPAPVVVSTIGGPKTFIVGPYQGLSIIEGSLDGIIFSPIAALDTSGADVLRVVGEFEAMRLRTVSGNAPVVIVAGSVPGSLESEVFQLEVGTERKFSVTGTVEKIVAEWILDFDDLAPLIAFLKSRFALVVQTSGAETAIWRVRLGGTAGAVDGTIISTIMLASPAESIATQLVTGLPRPSGAIPVKLTIASTDLVATGFARAVEILFAEA